MADDSVIIKKQDGNSLILNPDETVDVIDENGQVKGKEDFRFKLSWDLTDEKPIATDTDNGNTFRVSSTSRVERINGNL